MIPEANITIQDGGLGLIPASSAKVSVKAGVCSRGVVNDVYSIGDVTTLESTLGEGPAVEAAGDTLSAAGGPVIVLVLNPSTYGSAGSTTQTGTGTATVTGSSAPDVPIVATIILGGSRGTATISFSINGGAPTPAQLTAATVVVPGMPLVTFNLGTGTYVAADTYTAGTDGSLVHSGSGSPTVTLSASPVDAYDVLVEILGAGLPGVGTFMYSLDGGNSFSGQIQIPGGFVYVLAGTGLYITFSDDAFVAGDAYEFQSTSAAYNNTDLTNGITALLAASPSWGFVHAVGAAASASASASSAGVMDAQMVAAQTQFRYVFGVIECPTSESDATVEAAFVSFASVRTMVCAGDIGHISPLTGKILRRNCAWVVTSRIAGINPGKDPALVLLGAIPNVQSLYRDERRTSGLDAARFTTMRTFIDYQGYYVTNGNMMAPGGSDFSLVQYRRVMDRACQIVRAAEIPFLSDDVRVDLSTGFIDERDAQSFESKVNSQLSDGIVATGDASGASVVFSRTSNILSTETEPVTVGIVPKAYMKQIDNTIGFVNPALQ